MSKTDKTADNGAVYEYKATCHLVIAGHGHIYPENKENAKLGLTMRVTLPESEARRYGSELVRVGRPSGAAVTHDKQIIETSTK